MVNKMSDQWVKEAEVRGDEADKFSAWIEAEEDDILEEYKKCLSFGDVPEWFLNQLYEHYLENKGE